MIAAAIPIIGNILERVIPDTNARKAAKEELERASQAGELNLLLGQLEINKVESAHKSLFVAGARPFIMWVCGFGLAYNVLVHPILDIWFDMPPVDPAVLYPTLMGMLGMGAMRMNEKVNKVSREV